MPTHHRQASVHIHFKERLESAAMGDCQSRTSGDPKNFFEREKQQQTSEKTEMKRPMEGQRREGTDALRRPSTPADLPAPLQRSYDEEAIARMRNHLNTDANAFLLNNILLSVQFFENYDRELQNLKKNPLSDNDVAFNEGLAQHYKHVFTPDKLQEVMHANVRFARRTEYGSDSISCTPEAFYNPRIFVVHDNIEASEPGDESDYSTVMDAPYYKMLIEESNEPGYVKLRSLEILHNSKGNSPPAELSDGQQKEYLQQNSTSKIRENETNFFETSDSSSDDDEDQPTEGRGETLLNELRNQLEKNLSQHKIQKRSEQFMPSKKEIKSNGFPRSSTDNIRSNELLWKKLDSNVFLKLDHVQKESLSLSDNDGGPSDRRSSGILKNSNLNNLTFDSDHGGRRLSGVKKNLSVIALKGMLNPGEFKTYKNQSSNPKTIHEENDKFDRANYSPRTPSSGYDSDYGYSTITYATTPKPLEYQSFIRPENNCKLPVKCLTSVEIKVDLLDIDDEDEEFDEGSFHNRLFKKFYYLNGTYFMEHFVDLFIYKIGDVLRFSNDDISGATTQGASIYCDTIMNNSPVKCEILPCVYAAWSCVANEWLIRQRRVIRNPRNNFTYQWPTPYMVQKARRLGCLLLPIGFRPARKTNPEQIYQWKICFASVERYLDLCLAHSQVRCYMFTLCLFKTFIEEDDCKLGLSAGHIKAHLFTKCEDNYARWPEDRLGETLRIFLKSLYDQVMKGFLPCYFIPDCNLFKGVPKKILLKIQRKIANILESPVAHILMALQNLYYAKTDFYPSLDLLKLYKILVSQEEALLMLNPNLSQSRSYQEEDDDEDCDNEYKQRERSFWEQAKTYDREYVWQKTRQREILARRAVESKTKLNKPRQLRIDPKVIIPNRLDPNKKRLILEFFIPHFIKMAECSNRFKAPKQALIYLEHANRLCILLSSEPSGEIQAQEYKDAIWEKFEKFKAQAAMNKDIYLKVYKRQSNFSINSLSTTCCPPCRMTDHAGSLLNASIKDTPPTRPRKNNFTTSLADIHGDTINFTKQQSFEPSSPLRLRQESESENETESKL